MRPPGFPVPQRAGGSFFVVMRRRQRLLRRPFFTGRANVIFA